MRSSATGISFPYIPCIVLKILLKRQKSSIKSIGSQLKKFTAQGLPPFLMSKLQRYCLFSGSHGSPSPEGFSWACGNPAERVPRGGKLKATCRSFGPCKHSRFCHRSWKEGARHRHQWEWAAALGSWGCKMCNVKFHSWKSLSCNALMRGQASLEHQQWQLAQRPPMRLWVGLRTVITHLKPPLPRTASSCHSSAAGSEGLEGQHPEGHKPTLCTTYGTTPPYTLHMAQHTPTLHATSSALRQRLSFDGE